MKMKFHNLIKALSLALLLFLHTFVHSVEVTSHARRNVFSNQNKNRKSKVKFASKTNKKVYKIKVKRTSKNKSRELERSSAALSTLMNRKVKTLKKVQENTKSKAKTKFLVAFLVVSFLLFVILKVGNSIYRNAFVYPLQRENLKNVTAAIQKVYELRLNACSFAMLKNIRQRRMNMSLAIKITAHIESSHERCHNCKSPEGEFCLNFCKAKESLILAKNLALEVLKNNMDFNNVCGWRKGDSELLKYQSKYEDLVANQKSFKDTAIDIGMNVLWSLSTLTGADDIKNYFKQTKGETFSNLLSPSFNGLAYTFDLYSKTMDRTYPDKSDEDGYKWFKKTFLSWFQWIFSIVSASAPFLGRDKIASVSTILNNFTDLMNRIIDWNTKDENGLTSWSQMSGCTRTLEVSGLIVSLRWIIPEILSLFKKPDWAASLGLAMDVVAAALEVASSICYHVEAKNDAKKIEEIYNLEMKTNLESKCNQDIELMNDALNKEQLENSMAYPGNLAAIRKEIKSICKNSLISCLTMDAHVDDPQQRILTKEEFEKFYHISEEGPINEIAISSSYQSDDQFRSLGFDHVFRTYQNMNSIYYCKGCKPNEIITYICIEDSDKTDQE